MTKEDYSNWLAEDDYKKIMGQARLTIGGVLHPLRLYGQGVYCDQAVDQIMIIVEQVGKRLRGRDVPITYEIKKGG